METVVTVVGNKRDLDDKREVTKQTGQEFAERNGLQFFEASALEAVDELFENSIKEVLHRIEQGRFSEQQKRRSSLPQKVPTNKNSNRNNDTGCC